MFIDYAIIHVKAGDGGNGCLAFRREKYVPRGGPSGGSGGDGGGVYLQTDAHLTTLLPFRFKRHFRAERGSHGQGSNKHGKNGADLVIDVPIGTQVRDQATGRLLFDFDSAGQSFLVAEGGRGGRGNAVFATPTNQAPRRVEEGKPGQEWTLVLELKTLADVALVGFPNAGKSTLISVISAARPEIADYPFTTLTPNLGVVGVGSFSSFVVADIPGLIEGAHRGSGLGDRFLRHIERTRLLAHLVDVSQLGPEDPVSAWKAIQEELHLYNTELAEKPQLVVASKVDSACPDRLAQLKRFCEERSLSLFEISAATGEGVQRLKREMAVRLGVPLD